MRPRPNLFIIGAPKCGTTAWYEYLRRHRDINFSNAKEPHYFSSDFPNFRWAKTEQEYLSLFDEVSPAKFIGDASIMHLYSEVACRSISKFNSDAKVLIFVRRYDSFYQSYHAQLVLMHDESELDPARAWKLQADRREGKNIPSSCREQKFLQYREVGRFGQQVQRAMESFSADQIKVIVFEEWIRDPAATYSEIMSFLDLENDGFSDFKAVNEKRRDRNRILGKLLYRPPGFMLATAKGLKKAFGLKRLNVARKLRSINQAKQTTSTQLCPDLADEIVASFADDRKLLESLIGRPILAWDKSAQVTK